MDGPMLAGTSAAVGAAMAMGSVFARDTKRALAARAARKREEVLVHRALVGKPADDFGPAEPGLIKSVSKLTEGFTQLCDRIDEHEVNHRAPLCPVCDRNEAHLRTRDDERRAEERRADERRAEERRQS